MFHVEISSNSCFRISFRKKQKQSICAANLASRNTTLKFKAYTLRRKGSITLKCPISSTYLEPLKGSIHSGSSGFYIEPWGSILGQYNLLPKKWFYIEPFWSSIYKAGDGTISGSK